MVQAAISEIVVHVTMDCERPTTETHQAASGPPSYEAAETWTKAYARLAGEYGYPVTFYVHPEVAIRQARLFEDLERDGACIGLHLHPWRMTDGKYKAELGGLAEDDGRAALAEAIALWHHGLGRRPLYFRPGAMSANDATFRILSELGIRGGGVSAPGRVYADVHANWAGSPPDPHRAHRFFRQLPGDLDFANIPTSVDLSSVIVKNGRWYHWDLRPDFPSADYPRIARNIVAQIKSRQPAVPVINMVTHNDHDFTDDSDRVCRHFKIVLREITAACREQGVEPIGGTAALICDRVLATPPAKSELQVASGKIIYQAGATTELELPAP